MTTGAIPYVCLAWGQMHVQSSLAGILFGSVPLFTLMIAHFQTRDDRMTPLRIAGIVAGFAGVGAIVGPGALAGHDGQLVGESLILTGAACYGFGSVYTRANARHAPLVMAAGQNLCACAVLVPLSLALDAPWRIAPGTDVDRRGRRARDARHGRAGAGDILVDPFGGRDHHVAAGLFHSADGGADRRGRPRGGPFVRHGRRIRPDPGRRNAGVAPLRRHPAPSRTCSA